MCEENKPIAKNRKGSKAGITVCLNNRNEGGEPFEATVYFKNSGKAPEVLRGENAITLTVSGKMRLDIGKDGFVEIFAERSKNIYDAAEDEAAAIKKEEPSVFKN